MVQIFIQHLAQKTLDELFDRNQKQFKYIEDAIDNLASKGLASPGVKKLSGTKNIFRKRVGRWRILFTFEGGQIKIWIIAMEKGAKQDYIKWIFYIDKHS